MNETKQRARAALARLAIGDALGVPTQMLLALRVDRLDAEDASVEQGEASEQEGAEQ